MPQTTTYHVKVKNLTFYDLQTVRLVLNPKITGIKKCPDGNYIETEVDYIYLPFETLLKQSLANIEGLHIIYAKKEEQAKQKNEIRGFGTAELSYILQDADLTIERTKHFAGEEYTSFNDATSIHPYDWYETIITSIKITPQTQQRLNKVINKIEK